MSTTSTPPRRATAASLTPPDLTTLPGSALVDDLVAAAALGIAPGTLCNWRVTGRYNLNYVKIGKRVKYRVADLLDFISRRTRQHTGQTARSAART